MGCSSCNKRKRQQELAESTSKPHDFIAPDGTRTTYESRELALKARRANAGYGKVVPSHK